MAATGLSPGDRVQVDVLHDDYFDGKYQVSQSGYLRFQHMQDVHVIGLTPRLAEERVRRAFDTEDIYLTADSRVSIRVLSWAPIVVNVQGEVFFAGRWTLKQNNSTSGRRSTEELPGGNLPRRALADALRAAGGVTPWADLSQVKIYRRDTSFTVDLSSALTGGEVIPFPLVAGDRVVVPRAGEELQPELARPSAVTMPGIKIHVSNLIAPALNNAAAALDPSISLPYGSRLSQAVVAGNCAGGAAATNARRHVWWVRTDRHTGTTETLDVSIRELMLDATDERNPILFEGDSVVCFDSKVTNVREIFRTIGEMVLPFFFFREAR